MNTAPPTITALDGTEVGDQLFIQVGTWTGGPAYARQWLRDGTPIAGQTNIPDLLVEADIGSMVGCRVTGANAAGATSADAAPVGPIEAAP